MGLMVAAMALFAASDGMIKLVSQSISSGQVMYSMGLCGSVVFWILCRQKNTPVVSKVFFKPVVATRNAAEIISASTFFVAFTLAPLSSIAAITQSMPLIMTISAAFILKEHVGPRRWTAVFLGMIGVLIILRPDTGTLDPALLLALAGTVAICVRDLASRLAPPEATTLLLSFYAFFCLIPTGLLFSMVTGDAQPFTPEVLWQIAIMNVFSISGYFCITQAMRVGEVSAVTPLRYTRLPFAALVGYLLFTEVPDNSTLIGSALVIGSGLYVMLREAQIKRRSLEA